MSESGKVPQAGSASATTSRHLSSDEPTAANPTTISLRPSHTRLARKSCPNSTRHRGPPPAENLDRTRSFYATRSDIAASTAPSTAARHSEILGRRSFPQIGHSPDTGPSPRRPTPYCAVDWLRDSPSTRQSAGLPHRPLTNEAAGQPGSPPAIRRGSSTAPPTRKSQTPTVAARIAAHPAAVVAEESLPYLVSCVRYRFQLQHMSTHDGSIGHVFCQRL